MLEINTHTHTTELHTFWAKSQQAEIPKAYKVLNHKKIQYFNYTHTHIYIQQMKQNRKNPIPINVFRMKYFFELNQKIIPPANEIHFQNIVLKKSTIYFVFFSNNILPELNQIKTGWN